MNPEDQLTASELITLAEIVLEELAVIEQLAANLTLDQVVYFRGEIGTWNENRNDVDLEFKGDGVDLKTQRLLDAIRGRVRLAFGLPFYSPELQESSYALRNTFVY